MGRSKAPTHSAAPPRAKLTQHTTKNSSLKMNTLAKNAGQSKSNAPAPKMSTMQMDPPGGRRRVGRATKVQTPESSESSLSPVDVDSSNDAANSAAGAAGAADAVGGAVNAVNAAGSECRRSSRKKTIKFDVRDLLNKNRKSHKIQIEARIDSNAPKSGTDPASKEELDSKQKTFIEKSAIFRRYSFSENKQPPRPPPPPVALIKTIQQCVGELEQLPLDKDIDLAAISPIARRLSKTQEILTASMMKPKQVNSLIVTKLENATTSTPTAPRRGGRQKAAAAQSEANPAQSEATPAQLKRRGRPKKVAAADGSPDATTESSNDSSDVSETAIASSPTGPKADEPSVSIERRVNESPTSSTRDIDLAEKTDASAVTLSPSELMEPNMFVGAEEEVFTQALSSDESTVFLRSSPKEKSNDDISLFGRSDSTETNSSDDSERRRKKIRVSVKRVTLPSALREHVDLMLKNNSGTLDEIEIISSNEEESLINSKEANESATSQGEAEDCSQNRSRLVQTRGSSKRLAVEGDNSNSTTSDATPTPPAEGATTAAVQTRATGNRRVKNCRRKVNAHLLEEQSVQPHISVGIDDCRGHNDERDLLLMNSLPKQTRRSVQKQAQEVAPLQQDPCHVPKESLSQTQVAAESGSAPEASAVASNAASSPRTRSQKELQTETLEAVVCDDGQGDGSRKSPPTRSIGLRSRKNPLEPNSSETEEHTQTSAQAVTVGPEAESPAVIATENSMSPAKESEKVVTTRTTRSKVSEGKALPVSEEELAAPKRSSKKPTNVESKSPPNSPQNDEKFTHTESPPAKKPSKHLPRVVSEDHSSSSSERSDSPKRQNKKPTSEVDKSKEDTSSICSESSSVESSSSASTFSSRTASSKSSKKSSASSTSSTSSSSSTSSTSVTPSDGHERNTRSRRSQQAAAADSSADTSAAANEGQPSTEPNSESSEQSPKRRTVKATPSPQTPPKERAKLVHRRRSLRTNRFLLEEESNETSSESSETSATMRLNRKARSKSRCDGASVPDNSEDVSSSNSESKDGSESPREQKVRSRSVKRPGRFVPLKGLSPEREGCDDTSMGNSTMRETRARRKTISSASELEELLDHRISRGGRQKDQTEGKQQLTLKEVEGDEELHVPGQTKTDAEASTQNSAAEEEGAIISEEINDVTTVESGSNGQRQSNTVHCDLGSPKCKVSVKNIDVETLKSVRAISNKPEETAGMETEAEEKSVTRTSEEASKRSEETQALEKSEEGPGKAPDGDRALAEAVIAAEGSSGEPTAVECAEQHGDSSKPTVIERISEESERVPHSEAQKQKSSDEEQGKQVSEPISTENVEQVEGEGMCVKESASRGSASVSPVESACMTKVESSNTTPVDSSNSTQEDSPNSTPVDSANSTPVDSSNSTPVDSSNSTPIASSNSTPVPELEVDESAVSQNVAEANLPKQIDAAEGTHPEGAAKSDTPIITEVQTTRRASGQPQLPPVAGSKEAERQKLNQDQPEQGEHHPTEETREVCTTESSNSSDSLKSDASKCETKPGVQLESSFTGSLQKSATKPPSAKKLPKKKQPSTAAPPKSKKNQGDDLKKADTVASPKSRKKQTEATKADKKTDADAPSKRKSAAKNKAADAAKPQETNEPKADAPENKETAVPPPVTADVAAQQKEAPANPPKPMKSKGETKFFPDEHLKEETHTTDTSSSDDTPKESSPDSVPDPLKDIEKFIEDGVNLLKRGYKLDENEESVENGEATQPGETSTSKKCKLDENSEDKKQTSSEDDNSNSNSNSEHSNLASTPSSDADTPNGIRRSHRIKNNSKSAKCLVGRGLVRDRERFSMKDDEKTVYSIDDQKMDLAEVEAKNSKFLKDMEERLSNFRVIRENEYKCERVISKEAKRMLCDCFLTAEEEERGELGCGEDCLNRLLMIECGSDCTVKERCTNRRFTKFLYSPCRVFRTEKKGFGIMADIEILPGEFIMEYVGEVIDGDEFERRRNAYSQDKNKHYYFMALRSDAIIDATAKGNVSRFINHSCDPNAETQKWTVNGELRIGFFSRKNIMPGEEITFDYQYQRYGKEAQKCYCESSNCRGWIGEEPSSGEEGEDEEIDEEAETETEEEEDQEPAAAPTPIPVAVPPTTEVVGQELAAETPTVGKDVEPSELQPVPAEVTVEAEKPPKEAQPKKKKERRRQLDRKEEKLKRREAKQFLEDPDIEDEVRFLVKCGLRNQADTLRLSRLIVRAKLFETRLNLLQILRAGELPCRRLFLDYHGLRLLHGWMSEVIDDTEKNMEIRMALLRVLECLPISNKTMLTDSKVYQTVRDWSNNKESHSPSDESSKDGTTPAVQPSSPTTPEDPSTELQKLAAKLVSTWDNLPEIFRIPKRERIEQMKEHEREADRQYKGLGEDVSGSEERRNRDRFMRSGPNSQRFKWSRSEKDKERERTGERRRYLVNGGSGKDGQDKSHGLSDSHLSKEQRRELFAAKVARDEAEKRLAEERREFDIKCRFFGLDPKRMRPENMPFCVNPSTGQWYSTDKKPISTPPSYAHVQVPVKPKSTNPADYQLPIMDLPPQWKFAISPKGRIYYYHVKIRIPQWEHPIKILPLAGKKNTQAKTSESDSSNADCADSSDDDIDVIKGLDPVKLKAYVEKKIEDRRLQRYNRLVEEKPISPRKEEDRIYNQMEVRKYKENKEKIRKRKEEIRRRRDILAKVGGATPVETTQPEPAADNDEVAVNALPIQDYLLSSDEEDKIKEECNNSPLIDKIVQGDKIVDELDALQCKRPLKRALPIREKYEHKKRKVDKNKESTKSTKRSKDGEGSSSGSSSSKYRKIREKFRCEIAGIIVQHLRPYRKETCFSGRILTDDDFNHLARKLTHFVMVKELKYCESIGQTLVVTESVKNKSREFIKKYMAKYGDVYVRPENDPEFKEIPFL